MPEDSLLQLGAVAILFAVAIREFFGYLKTRKQIQVNGHDYTFDKAILRELQTMNTNHLNSLKEAIESSNRQLIETMHNDNTRMIELLGEIKGNLNQRR